MSAGGRTSRRSRTLIASLLGLGLAGIAGGIANVGNPSSAAMATSTASKSATTTTASATPTSTTSTPVTTPTSQPVTSPTGPETHLTALVFPDPVLHPGAIDPTETKATLCAASFRTSSVRPSTSYTTRLKRLEIGNGGTITTKGVTYRVIGELLPGAIGDYELDHLISLELGGNPTDPKNLWLEPWERRGEHLAAPGTGAESKDVLENRLHREICAGTVSLADAQREIASDWTTAQ